MIKYLIAFIFIINQTFAVDINNILKDIKQESNKELSQEKQRVQNFIDQKNQQKKILNDTKAELKKENKKTVYLKDTIDQNEVKLAKLEALLNNKVGDLGEMFGSVRQTSADFSTNFNSSLTASEFPDKKEIFEKYANSKKLPNINELKVFWHTMLDEIIQSGKVSKYNADIVLNSGEKEQRIVTRVGQFAAVYEGNYLNYDNHINKLVELASQPSNYVKEKAKEFENTKDKIANIVIDPTKGSLLEMINMNPTIMDRINQGGVVGYIIIALGAIGILFALIKMIILNIEHLSIKRQLKNLTNIKTNNSLGKIAQAFFENKDKPITDLEITMNEAILKEVNGMKRGESFVKLLSAVTPLLGLLGTVTGMIATFQAITLFGTGDPKLMAGGISTALITTVLGLVTAIPLLFAYTYISSKSDRLISILEEQSIGMLAKSIK